MLDIRQVIRNNIKQARKTSKLTQENIGKIWGISQSQYARYERGSIELNYSQIVSLCRILKISPNELFGYDEVKEDFIEI